MLNNNQNKVTIIALYLPQFYPIPENDKWWGTGFTEWTNVAKAKPLFRGHYQPKIPADLGFYDLRLNETREAQADLARNYGIDAFCYWHYWFGEGKRLLARPFMEVLESGKPEFTFCLGWANHSWKAKTWSPDGLDKMLIEQRYPGIQDYTAHFYELLPAFQDQRFLKINNKPFFLIWDPKDLPDARLLIDHWNELAIKNGMDGIYFVANTQRVEDIAKFLSLGFNASSLDLMIKAFHARHAIRKIWYRFLRAGINVPKQLDYLEYADYYLNQFPDNECVFPSILPNYDHSPRSGVFAPVLTNSTPENFKKLFRSILKIVTGRENENKFLVIRSWNEWAEGNYLEPDLKYGKGYLKAIKETLTDFSKQ